MAPLIRSNNEPNLNQFQVLNLTPTFARANFDAARRAAHTALRRRNPPPLGRERNEASKRINVAYEFFQKV